MYIHMYIYIILLYIYNMYNAIHRVLFHEHHTAPHLLILRQARQTNQQLQFLQQHLLPAEVAATQDDQQRGRGCGLPGKNPVAWEDLDPLIGLRDLFLQEIPTFMRNSMVSG